MITDTHNHTDHCWWNLYEARWVCETSDVPSPATGRPLVDVRDMIVVHTAMLREFRLAPRAVRRTEPGDRKQAAAVAGHLEFVCGLLHHHHSGEDELLWPKLRERTAATTLIDEGEAQHAEIDGALRDVDAARQAWADEPDRIHRDALADRLERLHAALRTHLELEERALLPLAAAALTADEWHAIGEAAVAATSKNVLPLVFGMFAYEGDPAVLRGMLAKAPALPRLLLPRIAPRVYARRARQVHGTARP